jgi:hypothetical protein
MLDGGSYVCRTPEPTPTLFNTSPSLALYTILHRGAENASNTMCKCGKVWKCNYVKAKCLWLESTIVRKKIKFGCAIGYSIVFIYCLFRT